MKMTEHKLYLKAKKAIEKKEIDTINVNHQLSKFIDVIDLSTQKAIKGVQEADLTNQTFSLFDFEAYRLKMETITKFFPKSQQGGCNIYDFYYKKSDIPFKFKIASWADEKFGDSK